MIWIVAIVGFVFGTVLGFCIGVWATYKDAKDEAKQDLLKGL